MAGTRVLGPCRAEGPTPIGPAVLAAEQFVSLPLPVKASAPAPVKEAAKTAVTGSKTP